MIIDKDDLFDILGAILGVLCLFLLFFFVL